MRILIVQTAFLGDVVLTLPLVQAVCQRFPQARVEVLTTPAHAPLLHGQPGVYSVLTYDKRGRQSGLRGFLDMVRTLRARRYDVALSPHRSWRSTLLLRCSRIRQRIGFAQPATRWAYTTTVPRPTVAHEVEKNLQLLTAFGPSLTAVDRPAFHFSTAERDNARRYFARHSVTSEARVIGFIPGSQWGTKRWPATRFADLIRRSAIEWPGHFVLFGGPTDRPLADTILSTCGVPVLDLIGRLTIAELPAYLDRCDMIISNDTGPMHIAAALGKPVVILYGPTTADLGFFPYAVPWEEASVSLACRPCHAHGPERCPLQHWRCMLDLTVDHVVASMHRLWHRLAASPEATGYARRAR